jgi:HPt (histidine-containing phosphotransfer) domain-containing protein
MIPPPEAVRLDPAALERLRELDPDGRHKVLTRVMSAFEASLLRMLEQLQALQAQPGEPAAQAQALRMLAHTIKSSAASVGALELARACADVEKRLREDGLQHISSDLPLLQQAAQGALQAVRAMLRA